MNYQEQRARNKIAKAAWRTRQREYARDHEAGVSVAEYVESIEPKFFGRTAAEFPRWAMGTSKISMSDLNAATH